MHPPLLDIPDDDFPSDVWEVTRQRVQKQLELFGALWLGVTVTDNDPVVVCSPCADSATQTTPCSLPNSSNASNMNIIASEHKINSTHVWSPDSDIQTINQSLIQQLSFASPQLEHPIMTPTPSLSPKVNQRSMDSRMTTTGSSTGTRSSTSTTSSQATVVQDKSKRQFVTPLKINTCIQNPTTSSYSPCYNSLSSHSDNCPSDEKRSSSPPVSSPLQVFHRVDPSHFTPSKPTTEYKCKDDSILINSVASGHQESVAAAMQDEDLDRRYRNDTSSSSSNSSSSNEDTDSNPFGDIDFEPNVVGMVDSSMEMTTQKPTVPPVRRRPVLWDSSSDDDSVSLVTGPQQPEDEATQAKVDTIHPELLQSFTKMTIGSTNHPSTKVTKVVDQEKKSVVRPEDVPSDEEANDEPDLQENTKQQYRPIHEKTQQVYSKNLWLYESSSSSSSEEEEYGGDDADFDNWSADFEKLEHPDGPSDEEVEDQIEKNGTIVINDDDDDDSSFGSPVVGDEENRIPEYDISPIKPHRRPRPTPSKKTAFGRLREVLGQELLQSFDDQAFDGRLASVTTLEWSNKLKTTAGQTRLLRRDMDRKAIIELNTKVIDCEERLRSTLLHEMCHAAAFCLDGVVKPPHGKCFWKWANRSMQRVRPKVLVTTTHSYEIAYKYAWVCTTRKCGATFRRHSPSIDPSKQVCGKCRGKLMEVDPSTGQPRQKRPLSEYNLFVKHHLPLIRAQLEGNGGKVSQREVMEECSRRWRDSKRDVMHGILVAD